MLNTFPNLLTYGFFAPTMLRVLVAFSFFAIAWMQVARRSEIAQIKVAIIGHIDRTLVFVSAAIIFIIGMALLLGWHTQIAALVGIVLCLKHAIYAKKYPRAIPLCRMEYVYLIVIMLSLLVSGAGGFAIDLPL